VLSLKPSYLGHIIALGLFVDSLVKSSASLAVCSVAALVTSLAYDFIERHYSTKDIKFSLPEEAKRKMQDLEQRVQTIEFGIKSRGF